MIVGTKIGISAERPRASAHGRGPRAAWFVQSLAAPFGRDDHGRGTQMTFPFYRRSGCLPLKSEEGARDFWEQSAGSPDIVCRGRRTLYHMYSIAAKKELTSRPLPLSN